MASLTHIGDSRIQPIDAEQAPGLDRTIAKDANEDAWASRSFPTTPSRSTGLEEVNSHTVADLNRSSPNGPRTDSSPKANLKTSQHTSPLILSSRSISSVWSNSSAVSKIWDSPTTPCRGSNAKSEAYELTPVTPPMSLSPTGRRVLEILTPCRISNTTTISKNREASMVHASEQNIRKDSSVKEEDFEPRKLVRGLTAEFLAIAKANATSAQGKYNLRPNFDFSTTLVQFAPALVQKETKTYPKVNNNAESCNGSRDTKPQTSIVAQNILSRTTMRTLLADIVPRDLQVRLEEAPHQCVASLIKCPQKRCTYKAKGSLSFDKSYLKSLAQCISGAFLIENVEKFIQTNFCGTHKNSANRRFEDLQRLIRGLTYVANDELPCSADLEESTSSCGPHRVTLPKKDEERCTRDIPHAETGSVSAKATATAKAVINATRPVPSLTDSYSSEFHNYRPKKWEGVSVQDALRKIITQPLHPTDLEDGFIYVFWDVKHFGMVKIGRTKDLQERLRQWNKDCKRIHKYHTELPKIPHVSRVERLIHMELKQQRKERRCESCKKTHVEWFEVSETHAVKVFQKWQQWIAQKPYELDAKSGKWILRPEMQASLSQLCEPVLLPPLAEHRQRRSPRRSSRLANRQKQDRRSQST